MNISKHKSYRFPFDAILVWYLCSEVKRKVVENPSGENSLILVVILDQKNLHAPKSRNFSFDEEVEISAWPCHGGLASDSVSESGA